MATPAHGLSLPRLAPNSAQVVTSAISWLCCVQVGRRLSTRGRCPATIPGWASHSVFRWESLGPPVASLPRQRCCLVTPWCLATAVGLRRTPRTWCGWGICVHGFALATPVSHLSPPSAHSPSLLHVTFTVGTDSRGSGARAPTACCGHSTDSFRLHSTPPCCTLLLPELPLCSCVHV